MPYMWFRKTPAFSYLLLRSQWSRALLPGLHLKRWIALLLVGVVLASYGLALLLRQVYLSGILPDIFYLMALTFLPRWARGLIFIGVGIAFAAAALWFINGSLITALTPGRARSNKEIFNQVLARAMRRQGPKIVAIGGGTGMPQLLRGLREYTDNLTAIVTVADDGGSSGRLRRQMGMLPPGDFRNNIAALSEAEDLMTRLFQYRFADNQFLGNGNGDGEDGEHETSGLAGHSFGNLFIATMAAVSGSFERGLSESSRVLAVRGRVLPSTLEQVTLCAEVCRTLPDGTEEWVEVEGESKIPELNGRIMRVSLKPENPHAYPEVIQAILQADLILAGPGSFFTSVIPNLLVPSIRDAICASAAPRIYICNVATQPGETTGFSVSDHMRHLRLHAREAFTTALANDNMLGGERAPFVGDWVRLPAPDERLDYRLFTGDLIDPERPWRHDPQKLAARVMSIYDELQAERARAEQPPRHTVLTRLHRLFRR
jgi:uncharacterized cofD-like protein